MATKRLNNGHPVATRPGAHDLTGLVVSHAPTPVGEDDIAGRGPLIASMTLDDGRVLKLRVTASTLQTFGRLQGVVANLLGIWLTCRTCEGRRPSQSRQWWAEFVCDAFGDGTAGKG